MIESVPGPLVGKNASKSVVQGFLLSPYVCLCAPARACVFTKGFVYPAARRQKQHAASIDGWSCSTCVDWVQRSAVTGNQE